MIFLTPIIAPVTRTEATTAISAMSLPEKTNMLESMKGFYTAPLDTIPSVPVATAIDAEGNIHENIELVITNRFARNGIRYISDGKVAIDYDTLVTNFRITLV